MYFYLDIHTQYLFQSVARKYNLYTNNICFKVWDINAFCMHIIFTHLLLHYDCLFGNLIENIILGLLFLALQPAC